MKVLDDVKRLVAETCAVDPAKIQESSKLVEFGVDSVRAMDLLVGLEDTFKIKIPDEDAAHLRTVADVARYVEKKLR